MGMAIGGQGKVGASTAGIRDDSESPRQKKSRGNGIHQNIASRHLPDVESIDWDLTRAMGIEC